MKEAINKGNTGIKGQTLVVPDVLSCPLCGVQWSIIVNGEIWPADVEVCLRYKAEAVSVWMPDKLEATAVLTFVCNRCGYTHVND